MSPLAHTMAVWAASAGATLAVAAARPVPGGGVWRKAPAYLGLNVVALAVLWSPPSLLLWPVALAAVGWAAAGELQRALHVRHPARAVGQVGCAVLVFAAPSLGPAGLAEAWAALVPVALVLAALRVDAPERGRWLLAAAGAWVVVPLALSCGVWAWAGGEGAPLLSTCYLAVAAHDAWSQLVGERWGARALAPELSPAKTVEGAAAGLTAAALVGAALGPVLAGPSAAAGPVVGAALGLASGAAALCGDLTASSWKRSLGMADFGHALGPHGGVLDRFDGFLIAFPALWLLARLAEAAGIR